jgi:hypothetical protein
LDGEAAWVTAVPRASTVSTVEEVDGRERRLSVELATYETFGAWTAGAGGRVVERKAVET